MDLKVVTYNIHKGLSQFNRRLTIHELRARLRALAPDIVFLQEVVGEHAEHARSHAEWPAEPQYEFLADTLWSDYAYGRNAVYDAGHHGNAVLSRFPILAVENQDISSNPFERRGLLHCELDVPGLAAPVHCICLHLALFEGGRARQIDALIERIRRLVPEGEPIIVAGDFNDWRNRTSRRLCEDIGLTEVFRDERGRPARSFPSRLPLFRLDRMYVRGFRITHTEIHHGEIWSRISDHALLSARLAGATSDNG